MQDTKSFHLFTFCAPDSGSAPRIALPDEVLQEDQQCCESHNEKEDAQSHTFAGLNLVSLGCLWKCHLMYLSTVDRQHWRDSHCRSPVTGIGRDRTSKGTSTSAGMSTSPHGKCGAGSEAVGNGAIGKEEYGEGKEGGRFSPDSSGTHPPDSGDLPRKTAAPCPVEPKMCVADGCSRVDPR